MNKFAITYQRSDSANLYYKVNRLFRRRGGVKFAVATWVVPGNFDTAREFENSLPPGFHAHFEVRLCRKLAREIEIN